MNRQVTGVIVILGIVAVIVLGYRLVHKQTKARIEQKQKAAFEQRLVAREVACDECGAVSPMDVPYTERRKFQVCPTCGAKAARPIVYYVCGNPECNRQLIKVANHVWGEDGFSPGDAIVCPNCGQARAVEPREFHYDVAKKIAEETGQEFP